MHKDSIKLDEKTQWILSLMDQGVVVNVRIRSWIAFTDIRAEDIGLDFFDKKESDFIDRYIFLGKKMLFPKNIKASIDRNAVLIRECLYAHSLNTEWGHFIPYSCFKIWEEQHNIKKNDYTSNANKIIENYDTIISSVMEDYRIFARDVWKKRHGKDSNPPESFVASFVYKIFEKFPSKTELFSKYSCTSAYNYIPIPNIINNESRPVDSSSTLRSQMMDDYMKNIDSITMQFYDDTVMEVRRRFSKVCQEIMDVVGKQKKQVLSLGRRRQLQKSIKVIKNINFYDDVEIERHSKEIHAMLCKDEKDLNIKEFKTVFKNAISDMDKQFFPKSF